MSVRTQRGRRAATQTPPSRRSSTGDHIGTGWPLASRPALWLLLGLALTGCAKTAPPADWAVNAHSSLQRGIGAYLSGDAAVAESEIRRARQELSRTGRPDLLARAELRLCAAEMASLAPNACPRFEALAQDALPADRAYARFLRGQAGADDIALLPPQQQAFGRPGPSPPASSQHPDALSRLVSAAVLLQTQRASPETLQSAVDAASAQGWRRPLLAWLRLQQEQALAAGQRQQVERLQRRIDLIAPP